jgi:phytoene desaturase
MYLGIKGKIPEFQHHTLLFTDDWKTNFDAIFKSKTIPKPASLYISKTSQSDTTAPKNNENIFVLVPLPAGIKLTPKQLEKVADEYLAQIHKTTGVDLKSRTLTRILFGPNDFSEKYNAWQSTMLGPSHKLVQSAFFRTPNKSKKVENLYYVGANTVPGIGVPMCLISAELVAKRIKQAKAKNA